MRVGLFAPVTSAYATPEYLAVLGPTAEERGLSSLWVPEHVVLFDDYSSRYPYAEDGRMGQDPSHGILEPFTTLAFLAATTTRIRLGTAVCIVPQRNPVHLAKEVVAIDWLSRGRFDFGVGLGWLAEEFHAVAARFDERGARCRSYLEVMRALWLNSVSEYHDRFYDLPGCRQYPKPIQRPHPPVHFGGHSEAALRRVADLGQGWYAFGLHPVQVGERLVRLEQLLSEAGRRREDILVSATPHPRGADFDTIARYRDAGVDQIVLSVIGRDRDRLLEKLDALATTTFEPALAL